MPLAHYPANFPDYGLNWSVLSPANELPTLPVPPPSSPPIFVDTVMPPSPEPPLSAKAKGEQKEVDVNVILVGRRVPIKRTRSADNQIGGPSAKKARPTSTRLTVILMPDTGGPGLDAASQAWANALNLSWGAPFAGLQDFDLLGGSHRSIAVVSLYSLQVNIRGLQFSNPLNCTSGVFFNNIPLSFPSSQVEYDQYQAAAAMTNFYAVS
ncbi:hypothetical protein B0H16DRAFT_1745005 [Mycena metata]|uniref:Uncharacterized protein n=1 Tax=Mycena metata TaxID=1033252 RepID=A0AAD7H4C8_9AGAR|nr:hypothetical protein B0H16DRAFT_1745005 [Mycena metata]